MISLCQNRERKYETMQLMPIRPRIVDYALFPRVIRVRVETSFILYGVGIETALAPNTAYRVRFLPQEEIATARTLCIGDNGCYPEIAVKTDETGVITFAHAFPREEIYTVRLLRENGDRVADCKVFAARDDLWERIPMRGNTHCHVCFSSDGHEDPVIAASLYRKAGYDYLAITDHHKIDGSVYAIDHTSDLPMEMALYYGEEVHVPNAYLHIAGIGARMPGGEGLDAYYHAHEEEVNAKVAAIAAAYADKLPAGVEPLDFAWRKWVSDTIHARGGISIIAHPFWEYDANNTSNAMLRYMIETKLFDAMEVIHGQDDPDCTDANRQVAFWNDLRAEGLFIPVVGVDDAHRRIRNWDYASDFNMAYTIIFAKDKSMAGFAEAIRGGYSVAVSHRAGMVGDVVGTYRLTTFAIFLLENYYPFHDDLCFEEGRAVKEAYLGSEEDKRLLGVLNGRVARFTDKFYGRGGKTDV